VQAKRVSREAAADGERKRSRQIEVAHLRLDVSSSWRQKRLLTRVFR